MKIKRGVQQGVSLFLCILTFFSAVCSILMGAAFAAPKTDSDPSHVVAEWEWVDPNQLLMSAAEYGFDDVDWAIGVPNLTEKDLSSVLPTQIKAVMQDGSKAVLDVTWPTAGRREYTPTFETPESGNELPYYYVLTVDLPDGYTPAEDVDAPEVLIQSAEIMPLAAEYQNLTAWRLDTGTNGTVSNTIQITSDKILATDADQKGYENTLLAKYPTLWVQLNYNWSVWENGTERFHSSQISSISFQRRTQREDGIYISTYQITTQDTYYWLNGWTGSIQHFGEKAEFFIEVSEPSDPNAQYHDVMNWRIGSITAGYKASAVKLPELKDFESDEAASAYAETISNTYSTIGILRNDWVDYEIQEIAFDKRVETPLKYAQYRVTLEHDFYWKNNDSNSNEEAITFNLRVYSPPGASSPDITSWRLMGNTLASEESGYLNTTLELAVDDEDFSSESYANTLKDMFPYIQLYRGITEEWDTHVIAEIQYLAGESTNEVGVYRIILEDEFYWLGGTRMDFKLMVTQAAKSEVINQLHAWKVINRETRAELGLRYNGNEDIALPDVVSRSVCNTYGTTIRADYEIQIDYQYAQGTFVTVDVKSIEFAGFASDTTARYKINTKNTYIWDWGETASFYVTVNLSPDGQMRFVKQGSDPEEDGNIDVRHTEERIGNEIWIDWPEETPADFDTDAFTERVGSGREFDRLAYLSEGIWKEYGITEITYMEGKDPGGLRDAWVFKITFEGDSGPEAGKTYYIVVYGTFPEDNYIVTDRVTDQDHVTVNFFDYWITEQYANDYRVFNGTDDEQRLLGMGINKDHLLVFAGGQAFGDQVPGGFVSRYGRWNVWTGNSQYGPKFDESDGSLNYFGAYQENAPFDSNTIDGTYKPQRGIVARTLTDGFPSLAVGSASWITGQYSNTFPAAGSAFYRYFSTAAQRRTTESLAYLFDPRVSVDGKESYTDVKGLFRMNNQGYYYFDSNDTFAELNIDDGNNKSNHTENRVTLYNQTWKLLNANGVQGGQFFPFNNWSNLFELDEQTNTIEQINVDTTGGDGRTALLEQSKTDDPINHYFGMTMEVTFQQPVNGSLNRGTSESLDMIFEFSGDDDVWIFIDDVLVGDVGGIHDAVKININFASGLITYDALAVTGTTQTGTTFRTTTLKEMFINAGKVDSVSWNGNTFANNSIHELKFFYMERGNDVSNCSLKYNLQPVFADRIYKMDETGNPLKDVEFNLYAAAINTDNYKSENLWHTADEFKTVPVPAITGGNGCDSNGDPLPIADVKTGNDGYGNFVDRKGDPLDLTSYKYLILEEPKAPNGYRNNPNIVLEYHEETASFTVVNQWESGAYSSYMTEWRQVSKDSGDTLKAHYAVYNPKPGTSRRFSEGEEVDGAVLSKGLSIVVPVIKLLDGEGNYRRWLPMYGSNTFGWYTISGENSFQNENDNEITEAEFIKDVIIAAFLQIAGEDSLQDWYLEWTSDGRLEGHMENLPGDPTRYVVSNSDWTKADLDLVTLFIPASVLEALDIRYDDADEYVPDQKRFEDLRDKVKNDLSTKYGYNGEITEEAMYRALEGFLEETDNESAPDNAATAKENRFSILYTDEWEQLYRTVVFIPNEQRELRVRKVDTEGNYVDGAVFAIFDTARQAYRFFEDNDVSTLNSTEEALALLDNYKSMDTETNPLGLESYGATDTIELETSDSGTQEGLLIFREDLSKRQNSKYDYGYGAINWPDEYIASDSEHPDQHYADSVFWLVEVYAPHSLSINENLVRIEVGDLAIYANATGYTYNADGTPVLLDGNAAKNDGITVRAALGKLDQTLVKYAKGNNVDQTLQDIVIQKQTQTGDLSNNGAHQTGNNAWSEEPVGETPERGVDYFYLHFGENAEDLTGQYGRHDPAAGVESYEPPIFEAKDGYIRVMPRQNLNLADNLYASKYKEVHNATTRRTILTWNGEESGELMDLDALYGLMNIVVVSDKVLPASLRISKSVEGVPGDNDAYEFDITLTPPDNKTTLESMYHGYIHETLHIVQDNDEKYANGPDGILGTEDDYTRPCTDADHDGDHYDLQLTDNGDGTYTGKIVERDEVGNTVAGPYTLRLKDGETYVIADLPVQTKYKIKETIITSDDDIEYETNIKVDDDEERTSNVIEGQLTVEGKLFDSSFTEGSDEYYNSIKAATVAYTNIAKRSGLSVEKKVQGYETNEAFKFQITLILPDGNTWTETVGDGGHAFPSTKLEIDGTRNDTESIGIEWNVDEDNSAALIGTFTLKAGWKVTFSPLIQDTKYKVVELLDEDAKYKLLKIEQKQGADSDSVILSEDPVEGTVGKNVLVALTFINGTDEFLTLPGLGVYHSFPFYLIGALLLLAGFVQVFVLKRRKRRTA